MTKKTSPADRLENLSIPEPNSGCWLWLGTTRKSAGGALYGMFHLGKMMGTHRAAYILFKGDIPEGDYVLHKCHNSLCVNPDHLYAGTPSDNMRDMARERRHPRHKLTPVEVQEIKELIGMMPQKEIASRYNVAQSQISRINTGAIWGCDTK